MNLKNYNIYMRKIRRFASMCNVDIEFKSNVDGFGEYSPHQRKVVVDRSLSRCERITTILHELGHFMDDSKNPDRWNNNHHYYGYDKIENSIKEMSMNQKVVVWECELEAWRNARSLAKMIQIPLGKWFDRDEISSLNSYRGIKIKTK